MISTSGSVSCSAHGSSWLYFKIVQWAAKMDEIGLTPSHTGAPGGKRGQRISRAAPPSRSRESRAPFRRTGARKPLGRASRIGC